MAPQGTILVTGAIGQFNFALERAVAATGLEWVSLRRFSFASNNLGWAEQPRRGCGALSGRVGGQVCHP